MFFEIIGRQALPEHVDHDDVEDAIAETAPGAEVTGAGVSAAAWHLDVEVDTARTPDEVAREIATALDGLRLGWVLIRHEHRQDAMPAAETS